MSRNQGRALFGTYTPQATLDAEKNRLLTIMQTYLKSEKKDPDIASAKTALQSLQTTVAASRTTTNGGLQ
jgi:hypothetical protein